MEPKKIATDFDKELRRIKTIFLHVSHLVTFINNPFFRFNKEKRRIVNIEMVI